MTHRLAELADELEAESGTHIGQRAYAHRVIPPDLFSRVVAALRGAAQAERRSGGERRLRQAPGAPYNRMHSRRRIDAPAPQGEKEEILHCGRCGAPATKWLLATLADEKDAHGGGGGATHGTPAVPLEWTPPSPGAQAESMTPAELSKRVQAGEKWRVADKPGAQAGLTRERIDFMQRLLMGAIAGMEYLQCEDGEETKRIIWLDLRTLCSMARRALPVESGEAKP